MESILINEKKLKIILSNDDMHALNINPEDLDYTKVSTKHIFWSILDKAQKTTGFDADKSKLYVQVYPSKDGGCEMYITKCTDEDKTGNSSQNNLQTISRDCFIVLGFGELYALCKRMFCERLKLHTTLYYDQSDIYILVIKKNKNHPSYTAIIDKYIGIPDYLCEYGKVHSLTERAQCYLEEHCKKIMEGNAVEILSSC